MGHLSAKDAFDRLGHRLESMPMKAPYTAELRSILEELYTSREAEVVASMPIALSTLTELERITGVARAEIEVILEGLCAKGLVIDLWFERTQQRCYVPSPFVIGIFEFTMMRTANDADHRRRARLFKDYWSSFLDANYGQGQHVALARTLPHETALPPSGQVEILDYERASYLVSHATRFAVGTCSCRHEKLHLGEKRCTIPLESCTALDRSADYLIRRGLARDISRTHMQRIVDRSRDLGLVMNADNVQKNVGYICHCCSCCCNLLQGISRFGYPNVVVSSTLVATVDQGLCTGCGACRKHCPVGAVDLSAPHSSSVGRARVSEAACLGCGLCLARCKHHALSLTSRRRRVLHPETTFERVLLTALEQGTLQELVFDNPNSKSQGFLRALVGGFLRLGPVKRAMIGERFRSVFLRNIKREALRRAHGSSVNEL